METHFNHYIRYVAPNHKTIFFLKQGKHSHRPYARSPSLCAISTSLLSYDLAKMLFYVRWGVGAIARRLIDYAYFAFDKFWSLSIRVDYNAPPSITWKFAFHTLPVPTNIPFRSLDELSQLQHPIAKFSSIKSHCTTPHVPRRKHFHITCLASS